MPIVMWEEKQDEHGGWWPRFVCDSCGQLIVDGSEGVVAWNSNEERPSLLYVAHRGRCDSAQKRVSAPPTAWMTCADFVKHLSSSIL